NLADHPAVDLNSGWQGEGSAGPITHSIATYRSGLVPDPSPDMMFWLVDPSVDGPAFSLDPIILGRISRASGGMSSGDPADPPGIGLPGVQDPAGVDGLL